MTNGMIEKEWGYQIYFPSLPSRSPHAGLSRQRISQPQHHIVGRRLLNKKPWKVLTQCDPCRVVMAARIHAPSRTVIGQRPTIALLVRHSICKTQPPPKANSPLGGTAQTSPMNRHQYQGWLEWRRGKD